MKKLFSKAKVRILLGVIIVFAVLVGLGVNVQIKNVSDTNSTQTGSLALVNKDTKRVITIGLAGQIEAGTTVDYTATGVADNTVFTNAINALPSTGGEIHIISSGSFTFAGTVSRAINNVTISGTGIGTLLNYDASHALFSAGSQSGWVFRDFATDAGGVTLTSATSYTLQNVKFGTTYYAFSTSNDMASSQFDIPVGRSNTITIASSTTSAGAKAQADYICDGTADDVQIQTAITALSTTGGTINLLDGTYYIHTAMTDANNITLKGQGNNTIIKLEDSHNASISMFTISHNYVTIRDMQIDGNSAQQASGNDDGIIVTGTDFTCKDVYLHHFNHYSLDAHEGSTNLTVDHCKLANSYTGVQAYADNAKIINCTVDTMSAYTGSIDIYQGSNFVIQGNYVNAGTMGIAVNQADGSKYGSIVGNTVVGNSDSAINLDTAYGVTVTSNQLYTTTLVAFRVELCSFCNISSNVIVGAGRHGIYIHNSLGVANVVNGNVISSVGSETDNTYAGICVEAGTGMEIANNVIRQAAAGNLQKYGIDVSTSDATKTWVHGNDLYNSGKTGDYHDAGTGTLKRDNRNLAGTGLLADS